MSRTFRTWVSLAAQAILLWRSCNFSPQSLKDFSWVLGCWGHFQKVMIIASTPVFTVEVVAWFSYKPCQPLMGYRELGPLYGLFRQIASNHAYIIFVESFRNIWIFFFFFWLGFFGTVCQWNVGPNDTAEAAQNIGEMWEEKGKRQRTSCANIRASYCGYLWIFSTEGSW